MRRFVTAIFGPLFVVGFLGAQEASDCIWACFKNPDCYGDDIKCHGCMEDSNPCKPGDTKVHNRAKHLISDWEMDFAVGDVINPVVAKYLCYSTVPCIPVGAAMEESECVASPTGGNRCRKKLFGGTKTCQHCGDAAGEPNTVMVDNFWCQSCKSYWGTTTVTVPKGP